MNMRITLSVLFLLLCSGVCGADTVILKNGKKYDTPRAWKENGQVRIEKFGAVMSFPESDVAEIVFAGNADAPKPKPAYTPPTDTVPYPYWQLHETLGVTMAGFQKIRTGMEYREVAKILGEEGEEASRNEMGGFVTVMYTWKAKDFLITGGNMNAMFQNGRLTSKAQTGLR